MAPQNDPGVNLEQLLSILKRKGIPLPFEIGTFVALEACEALGGRLGVLRSADVWLADDGNVSVAPEVTARSEEGAARAVVTLLADLLVAAAPGVPSMLLELVENGPADGVWTLSGLRDDLEACLVPLNRGATKRVLSRLLREARREGDRPSARPPGNAPTQRQVDDEFDALLGGGGAAETALPTDYSRFESVRPPRPSEDDTQQIFDDEVSAVTQRRIPKLSPSLAEELEPDDEEAVEHQPTNVLRGRPQLNVPIELNDGPEREGRGGLWVGVVLLALTAGLGGAYFGLGKDKLRALMGGSQSPPSAPVVAAPSAEETAPKYGDLVVTSTPDRAQVFLFAGRGPAIVEKLPVGIAHELLAIAEGRAPTRALVPADAAWEDTPDGPRYELAMQTGEEAVEPAEWDFGSTRLPSGPGTPSAERGNVRVVTSPPGARVYQLIGFTPNARVDNIQLGEDLEVLVYLPGYAVERLTVDREMFVDAGGKWVAQVDAILKPLPKKKR